jgi:peptidoglycan/LPS O-acetylase OafA/YrhL
MVLRPPFGFPDNLNHIFSHLFFVHTFSLATHGSIVGVAWTLGVEMMFYIFILLCYPVFMKASKVNLLIFGFLITWCLRYIVFCYTSRHWTYFMHLPTMFDTFCTGIVLAKMISDKDLIIDKISGRAQILLCAIFFILSCLVLYLFVYLINTNSDYWNSIITSVFSRSLVTISTAFFIISFIILEHSKLIYFNKIFMIPIYLGEISYSIYMFHMLIIQTLINFDIGDNYFLELVLVYTIVSAIISWNFIEKPFIKMAHRNQLNL